MPYFRRAALTAFALLAFTALTPPLPGVSGSALAQFMGPGGPTPNAINLNSSRSNIYRGGTKSGTNQGERATTVKSSKSNTSDRMGGGGGKGTTLRATTVKSSKSNTSDRMGGGGGKGAVQLNPQPEPPGRR